MSLFNRPPVVLVFVPDDIKLVGMVRLWVGDAVRSEVPGSLERGTGERRLIFLTRRMNLFRC